MFKIDAQEVNLFYGKTQALKNVSMQVEANEIVALIGPSGCGKSTFLRTINRMNDLIYGVKISGNVKIDDKNIYSNKIDVNELRKEVGMVFQKPTVFNKSIFENVAYGLRVNGISKGSVVKEKVEKALIQAALWDEVKDNLKKSGLALSGGQQQRLCIARTIAVEPKVILMDEPTSALDPISTSKVEELLIELKKDYTIMIVTHNMQQAARVSDKTAFFYVGELVEYDKTPKIFKNASLELTQNYVGGKFG